MGICQLKKIFYLSKNEEQKEKLNSIDSLFGKYRENLSSSELYAQSKKIEKGIEEREWGSGKNKKLSWDETYKEMTAEREDWDDFDVTLRDGMTGECVEPETI